MPNIDWSAIQSLARAKPGASPAPNAHALAAADMVSDTATAAQKSGPGCLFFAKNALNGGEIAPEMLARFDQPRHATACHEVLNFIPMPQGGLMRRPGFQYMDEPMFGQDEENYETVLVPFIFSASESRILELSANASGGFMRVIFPEGGHSGAFAIPWQMGDLHELRFCQSADVIFVAHHNYPPMKICRYADDDWRVEEIKWLPKIQPPTITYGWVGPVGVTYESWTSYSYVATAVDGETGEESMPSEPVGLSHASQMGERGSYNTITVEPVAGASEYRIYRKHGGVYGYIGRLPADSSPLVFEDKNITPDVSDTPPDAKNPFDGPGSYPSVVFLHQQRLGFAATDNKPMTIWMSESGNYESMSSSVPPQDDQAIEVTLAGNQANRIVWCATDRDGLAVGTEGGEWFLTGAEGTVVTPSNLAFKAQTNHGSEKGGPGALRAGEDLLFVQRGGRIIRQFNYSFSEDRYQSSDLALLAKHLFRGDKRGIVSWAWQPEPYCVLWLALEDGNLLSLTYMKEHDVVAWARHGASKNSAGRQWAFVESVASIPAANGDWQVWAVIVHRDQNGVDRRFVERMRPFTHDKPDDPDFYREGPLNEISWAEFVPCLPETTLQTGSTFERARKLNAVKARVMSCGPLICQVESQGCQSSPAMSLPARGKPGDFVAQADWNCPLGAGWREDNRLRIVADNDTPAIVLGLLFTVELADLAGNQK